jgi:Abortive infection alpha
MSNEITEVAKASQEMAKTASSAIEASSKLGAFLARILGEPIEGTIGILTDKIRFARWERQLRLFDRFEQIMRERGLSANWRPVPPKLAFPIVENASLENDDTLQDLWAQLLASAVNPKFEGEVRTAYVDIIKQLEAVDAHILHKAYSLYREETSPSPQIVQSRSHNRWRSPLFVPINARYLHVPAGLSRRSHETSIDNLFRLRCLSFFISNVGVTGVENGALASKTLSTLHEHDWVCITALGISFVEACMPESPQL